MKKNLICSNSMVEVVGSIAKLPSPLSGLELAKTDQDPMMLVGVVVRTETGRRINLFTGHQLRGADEIPAGMVFFKNTEPVTIIGQGWDEEEREALRSGRIRLSNLDNMDNEDGELVTEIELHKWQVDPRDIARHWRHGNVLPALYYGHITSLRTNFMEVKAIELQNVGSEEKELVGMAR